MRYPSCLKLVLVLALGGVLLAGCTAPAPTPSAATEAPTGELSVEEHFKRKLSLSCEPGKEHWRAQGQPKRGGIYRPALLASGNVDLDVTGPGGASSTRIPQVYNRLVTIRACYYEDTAIVPDLAKSWQVSPDGLTWTFKLREGARWHNKPPLNGRPLTAADVAWTIDHQKQGGGLRTFWEPVTYETPDAHTVVLRLKEPQADFLGATLADRNSFVVPQEVKEQYGDFKTVAIGSGPFMVKDYKTNQITVLERNPDWWEVGLDGKPVPYLDGIEVIVFSDYAAEVAAFRSGQLDHNSSLGYTKIDARALKQAMPKLVAYEDVVPIPRGLFLNQSFKPFEDVRVRRAIALATDYEEILEGAFQGAGLRTGHLPSAITQYGWPAAKVREKFKPDPERAKRLLAEAGYGPGQLQFSMKVGNVPSEAPAGEISQKQLEAVGIKVQIEVTVGNAATLISRRQYDAAWSGVTPPSFFPDRWMGSFLRTGGSHNVTGLSDPKVDALSLAQGKELDPGKRKQIMDELLDRVYELMPWVPVNSLVYHKFYSCQVRNMPSTNWYLEPIGAAHAWLDPTGC